MFQRLLSYATHALRLCGRQLTVGKWALLLCLSGVFLFTAADYETCTDAIDTDDCATLQTEGLANALRGEGGEGLNWGPDTPMAEWVGVTVDPESKRVTRLDLRDLDLQGTIPAALANLTGLERLWLSGNHLTGEIPLEMGGLSNLEWVTLRGNQFTGCLPDEFRNLSYGDVEQIGLPYCAENEYATLLEIRDALVGDGTALNWTDDLDVSEWDGVSLNAIMRVTSLSLSEHGLRGTLPAGLGDLTHLQSVNLSRNSLSGALPAALGNLSSLRSLNLSRNGLSGELPVELGQSY